MRAISLKVWRRHAPPKSESPARKGGQIFVRPAVKLTIRVTCRSAHIDVAMGKQLLDIKQTERETKVQLDSVLNHGSQERGRLPEKRVIGAPKRPVTAAFTRDQAASI